MITRGVVACNARRVSTSASRCARCESVELPLRSTARWGKVCPACWRLHEETFRPRSVVEKTGLALVLAGLGLWVAYLLLVLVNLFF